MTQGRRAGSAPGGLGLLTRIFARTAAPVLVRLSARVESGGVTVSAEDQQGVRHWVFCDLPLPGGARCALPVDHLAPCARRPGQT
ncbi:hypothetical protein ACWD5Z_10285 [Micromonospora chokoriensis]